MNWTNVNLALPRNDEIVLVLCKIGDPNSILKQNLVNWIYQGLFNAHHGWKVYGLEKEVTLVVGWMELPEKPDFDMDGKYFK